MCAPVPLRVWQRHRSAHRPPHRQEAAFSAAGAARHPRRKILLRSAKSLASWRRHRKTLSKRPPCSLEARCRASPRCSRSRATRTRRTRHWRARRTCSLTAAAAHSHHRGHLRPARPAAPHRDAPTTQCRACRGSACPNHRARRVAMSTTDPSGATLRQHPLAPRSVPRQRTAPPSRAPPQARAAAT